ncbi:MAG TPA: TatD family hydrolase [Actinomycetota bacterium]|jgi:TatD DNase family protein
MWFDSHCHLHMCGDPAAAVAGARSAGVESLVAIGIDVASSEAARDLAHEHGVWASAGVHPNSALEWDDAAASAVAGLLADDRVVAVGETGLDFYRDYAPVNRQRAAFSDHIALAKDHAKCLVIHTRDSIVETIDMLADAGPPERLIFHCWSAGRDDLDRALELGAYVSFAGNVTFKNAPDLRAMAARVPEDRLLVETDSPFLAPVPHRGRSNEPAFVTLTGEVIAAERGVSTADLAATTTANARRAFAL